MRLIDGIRVTNTSRIAFVGAGGKSTAMFRLARQWEGSCIVSTSTHLAVSQAKQADAHFIIEDSSDLEPLRGNLPEGIILLSGPFMENQRVTGLSDELFEEVCDLANIHQVPVLIEADGSRRLPIKAPAQHEPAIPPCVDTVVVLAGLKGLGKILNKENVHRPEIFNELTGLAVGEKIGVEDLEKLLSHPNGGLKNISEAMDKILVLNQADSPELVTQAINISKSVLTNYHTILISSLDKDNEEVIKKEQKVAGIVLAAGGSERLGRPKQLLNWEGESFIRKVSKTAISAGLDPVIVVTGADAEKAAEALEGLNINLVHNENWQEGQSTSVKLGLENLPKDVGSVVFLLVDQPQMPATLIRKLVETHSIKSEKVIATFVDGRKANPVLFDRSTFSDLAEISGDVGGRQIFSKYEVFYLPWLDPIIGLDVDTEEDYLRLINFKIG